MFYSNQIDNMEKICLWIFLHILFLKQRAALSYICIYIYNFSYFRWNLEKTKKFTYNQAINLLVKSRKFTKEQSAVVLSRILVPTGDGMYR